MLPVRVIVTICLSKVGPALKRTLLAGAALCLATLGTAGCGQVGQDHTTACALYHEESDLWVQSTPVAGSRTGQVMVWTGSELLLWGGYGGSYRWGNDSDYTQRADGLRYRPAACAP